MLAFLFLYGSSDSRQQHRAVPFQDPLAFFSTWLHLGSPAPNPEGTSSETQECVLLGELKHFLGCREATVGEPTTSSKDTHQSFTEEAPTPTP